MEAAQCVGSFQSSARDLEKGAFRAIAASTSLMPRVSTLLGRWQADGASLEGLRSIVLLVRLATTNPLMLVSKPVLCARKARAPFTCDQIHSLLALGVTP